MTASQASGGLPTQWRIVGASAQGVSHERAGAPNQDAIDWWPRGEAGSVAILTVSDGHGGARYLRSAVGAQLAVETALATLRRDVDSLPGNFSLSAVKHLAEDLLPRELTRVWRNAVQTHLDESPISAEEWSRLDRVDRRARAAIEHDPAVVYGATLLVVVVTQSFIVYIQLGDGDILVVTDEGEVSRPLPRDDRLFANETTSLCGEKPWNDMRVAFQPLADGSPVLIMASTDGYANSFRNEAGFLKVGADMLAIVRSDGLGAVARDLEGWLSESSRAGSGDDITVGIMCRLDAVQPPNPEPAAEQSPGAAPVKPGHSLADIIGRFHRRKREGD